MWHFHDRVGSYPRNGDKILRDHEWSRWVCARCFFWCRWASRGCARAIRVWLGRIRLGPDLRAGRRPAAGGVSRGVSRTGFLMNHDYAVGKAIAEGKKRHTWGE